MGCKMTILETLTLISVTSYLTAGLIYVGLDLYRKPPTDRSVIFWAFCVFMVIFWPWGVFEDNNKSWRVKR